MMRGNALHAEVPLFLILSSAIFSQELLGMQYDFLFDIF